ncbi:MAG: ABC transporter permease subunit [Actinomycetia bacterium]|nr:ABC transporter permease subunit [Actinomycetes bacterium]
MMNLLMAESMRLWSRRMTRFFPAILAVLMVAGVVIAYLVISNDTDNSPDFVIDMAGGADAGSVLGPVSSLLPIMAFVIGASYIGADVKTGVLEQILTWEPRRLRVLAARLLAAGSGVAVLAMALGAFLVGLLFALAVTTGTVDGTTGELWGNIGLAIVRLGLASALFCAFGLGVTVLVNNSVGSIVGFVIYWFIIENFLVAAFLPKVAVYLPITNASAFANGTDVERIDGSVFSDDFELVAEHSYLVAGLLLAAWTAVAVIGAGIVFQRRDIA